MDWTLILIILGCVAASVVVWFILCWGFAMAVTAGALTAMGTSQMLADNDEELPPK